VPRPVGKDVNWNMSTSLLAVGVDGAPAGWVAACLHADATSAADASSWETRLHLCKDIQQVVDLREGAPEATLAIDVPIGLPDAVSYRDCDIEARKRLGRRANSVFAPPARYMLAVADDYAAIRDLVAEERRWDASTKGLSAQAAAITPKIQEVDDWVRVHDGCEAWLYECHPELSWHALSGGEVLPDKRSGAGPVCRLRLLRGLFPDAEDRLAMAPWPGRQATLSDLLDAYAALSTALACARGEHTVLGGERDSEGVVMRIAM
jgi:predicted RNase H-like nuclease